MGRGRVLVTRHLLLSDIENSDLRVRYTTAVPGLRVRLVLVVSVALRRTWATHADAQHGGNQRGTL